MKKLLKTLLFTAAAAALSTSCEDVPAPYENPNGGQSLPEGVYLSATFASSLDPFEAVTLKGTPWTNDYNTAKATGWNSADKTNTESEAYLVSPEVDLANAKEAYLQFEYILMYAKNEGLDKVLITDSYTGNPAETSWEDITGKLEEGKDWDTFAKYSRQIDGKYIGKKVRIAFYYTGTAKGSRTWEVKNATVREGRAETQGGNEQGGQGEETPDVLKPVNGSYISETFASSMGVFSPVTLKGDAWIIDFKTAKATGYHNDTKQTNESDAYIVSKPMDMSASAGAVVSFEYILRYATENGKAKDGVANQVLMTDNYTGDASTTQWTDITGSLEEGKDWNTFYKYEAAVPEQFKGKGRVVVALRYTCRNNSATWEVKNLAVKEGKPSVGEEPGEEGGQTGGEVSGNSVTLNFVDAGIADKAENPAVTLADGTTITFGKAEGTTTPKYYSNSKSVRVYAKNSIAISSSKDIVAVKFVCNDKYQDDLYNGNEMLYLSANGKQIAPTRSGTTEVAFSGFSAKAPTIVNDHTEAKGGVQLRIVSITITYAE